MPHIYIPELKANFLLDTGSSRSIINPDLAYKYYKNRITNEDFNIQTAHNISYHNEVVQLPIFQIFNVPDSHKFYLFKFSTKYDGLIGTDFLKQIKASIDIDKKLLSTPCAQIKIIYEPEELTVLKNQLSENNHIIIIPPRTEKVCTIPVNIRNGVGLIDHLVFAKNIETPRAIVNIKNYFALITITNSDEHEAKLEIHTPFDIEPLNISEMNFIEKMETNENLNQDQDNILKSNLKNIRLSHCNTEEKDAIRKLCFEYRDIFYSEKIPLTFTNEVRHKINLSDESPIFTKTYRYPEIHKAEVKDQITKMLEQGIIQNSFSPWSSPIWIVPKKLDASGKRKWRLVCDFRKINEKSIDDKYPLPNITDMLDKLGKSQYFSTLDLANGFHQIEMDPNDVQKTAFSTENGHYEYKRMPFGLKNAPSTFQRVMDNVLRGLQNEICAVYLDDIVIFSTSLQEHVIRLKSIFERLKKANLKVQLDKCEFFRKEVAYLGHVITPDGVKPNPDKIYAIKNFPIPKTQTEIKSFLGLIGYYRKFIKDFAKITKPLTLCLKKDSKINIDDKYISAFNTCKNLLINSPILQYPDFSQKFILTTDASNIALGGVLSQGSIGSDKPIAFASRTLNESEQKYSTIEKELLAIVWACKYFRPYLFGRKFTIYTDHRPLVWLFNLKEPNSKLVRWRLKLEEYDYDITYKAGKTNTNADALSRVQINILDNESLIANPGDIDTVTLETLRDMAENVLDQNNQSIQKQNENPSTSQNSQQKIEKIKIISDIRINAPDQSTSDTQHSTNNETTNAGIKILDEIINNKVNQILVFPWPHHKVQVIQENYQHHKIITLKIPENNENLIFEFLRDYTLQGKPYCIYFHTDQLYYNFNKVYLAKFSERGPKLIRCTKLNNTIKDNEEQILLIKNHHEGKTNHRGITETIEHIKKNYYWIGLKETVTNFINACDTCTRTKYARKKPYTPLLLTETASKPFSIIHIDIFTFDNQNYLTLVDAFTKLAQAYPITGKTAIHVSKTLIKYFSCYGIPDRFILDNGGEFNNETVKEILALHKIKVHFTTPHHHDSNGIVERFHSSIIEHLRILLETHPNDKENIMDYAIIAYNNSIHSTTKYTPFELTFGHTSLRDPHEIFIPDAFYTDYAENHKQKLERVYEKINQNLNSQKEKIVSKHNTHGDTNEEFKLGQTVFKQNPKNRNKKYNKFLGPYEITKILERNKVEISTKNSKNKKEIIHIKELRKPNIVTDSSS